MSTATHPHPETSIPRRGLSRAAGVGRCRVALFLHGPYLEDIIEDAAWEPDWCRLPEKLVGNDELAGAFLHDLDSGDPVEQTFRAILSREHYTIRVTSPASGTIQAAEDALERLHTEFALDVVTSMPLYDTAVLVAGSARFAPLVRLLQRHGKRAQVVCSRKHIDHDLALAAHKPLYYIEDLTVGAGDHERSGLTSSPIGQDKQMAAACEGRFAGGP